MKKLFLFSLTFTGIVLISCGNQNASKKTEKIVETIVEAINNKKPELLEKFLAPDFEFSGQKAPSSTLVLNLLLEQLNDTVKEYRKISETENDGELTLIYEFTYAKRFGQRTTTIVFNKDNLITQLDLFAIEVKTMREDEVLIENERLENRCNCCTNTKQCTGCK
jgi:hypothetical protein